MRSLVAFFSFLIEVLPVGSGGLVASGGIGVELLVDDPHVVLDLSSGTSEIVELLSHLLLSTVHGLGGESSRTCLVLLSLLEVLEDLSHLFFVGRDTLLKKEKGV